MGLIGAVARRENPNAEAVIRAEIAARGAIPFARFMELALYAPGVGYYQRVECPIGRSGDFYTSVSVGPLFGFLLASRFAEWCGAFERIDLVEAAAHDGRLAEDVLTALRDHYPGVLERVRYRIVEPLAVRRDQQRQRLAAWGGRVTWVEGLDALPPAGVEGVIFANELLDAFPVRRLGWDGRAGEWFEWGVTVVGDGRLEWCRLASGEPVGFEVPEDLKAVMPDGQVAETSPAATAWWQAAARRLAPGRGRLAAFDYGYDADLPIRPGQPGGSLRAYHRHRVVEDLLARPGDQDLTAHVDFARIRGVGEAEGLETEAFLPQGRWLSAVAAGLIGAGGAASAWLGSRARALQTLTHPVHLGQAMKVLVQRR